MLDLKWSSEQIRYSPKIVVGCPSVGEPTGYPVAWSRISNGVHRKKKKKKEKKGRSKVRTRTFVTGDLACERKPEGTTGNDMTLRFTVF